MPADGADSADGTDAPPTAVALLGNETRMTILRTLGERPYEAVSFVELRASVDPDLDSEQFN